jgi:hypothetical protein
LLAGAGALIELSVAVGELASAMMENDLNQIGGELYLNMVQETLAALEPGAELVAPILQRLGTKGARLADGLVVGARALGGAAMGLEGVRNVVTGSATIATLFAPEKADTDLAHYLDREEGLPALLEATKGVVQVAAGGSAVGALVVGAGTTVATLSLGVWVSVGLVAITMLDVLIYADTGGESPTQGFESMVRKARDAQFLTEEDRILMPDESATVEAAQGLREQRATCLLARRLGLIHHVLKA